MKRLTAKELALYFGCEAEIKYTPYPRCPEVGRFKLTFEVLQEYSVDTGSYYEEVKPILRPLSDITRDEIKELTQATAEVIHRIVLVNSLETVRPLPQEYTYLLSQGFDLFNWIEQGLAIDKTAIGMEARNPKD